MSEVRQTYFHEKIDQYLLLFSIIPEKGEVQKEIEQKCRRITTILVAKGFEVFPKISRLNKSDKKIYEFFVRCSMEKIEKVGEIVKV